MNKEIDTSKISPRRGQAVGKAFYNAFKIFVRNPENEKMIKRCADEIRQQEIEKTEEAIGIQPNG